MSPDYRREPFHTETTVTVPSPTKRLTDLAIAYVVVVRRDSGLGERLP